MEIIDVLTVLLPTEIYQLIIFSGIIYFILFFYGTKQWERYTEFDKVAFSVIFGGFVWYFFILPISIFMFILNIFHKPEIIIQNDFPIYSYIIYFILALYLIVWRLFLANNKPLRDNNTFLRFTELLIAATILSIALVDYTLYVAFFFSTYQEHLTYILISIISLPAFLVILYYTFLKIFPVNDYFFPNSDKLPYLDLVLEKLKNKKLWTFMVIIISVVAALIGTYFLRTTSQMEEEPNRLVIEDLYINLPNVNLTGTFFVTQNYTIKFGLIPWAKIELNISSADGSDKTKTSDYNFSGNYLYIKNLSWNTINVKAYGWKKEYNISKFHTLKITDLNNTIQRWEINFYNPHPYDIDINEVVIEKGGQLKFINYSKELSGEVADNPTDHRMIIKHVELPKYWNTKYANYSITLFFEKNNL